MIFDTVENTDFFWYAGSYSFSTDYMKPQVLSPFHVHRIYSIVARQEGMMRLLTTCGILTMFENFGLTNLYSIKYVQNITVLYNVLLYLQINCLRRQFLIT